MSEPTCVTSDPRVIAARAAKDRDLLNQVLEQIAKELEAASKERVEKATIEYRK